MSDAEVEHVAKGLQLLIVPELAIFVEIDGRVVGACFGLLDYNPRIKEIDGRLFPFGFIHLLRKKSEIKKIRLISTNVLPEYQMQGLGLVLMHGIVPKAIEWGMQEAEFSWVLESNSFSRGALTKGGAKITKTYRIYDIDFDPAEVVGPAASAAAGRQYRGAAGNPAGRLRPRSQRLPQGALADLCRRSAMGAAVVAGPERVPQSPQASLLSARGRREIHRLPRRRAPGTHPRQRRPPLQRGAQEQHGLLRHVRIGRRPGNGPGPDRSRLEMAARPRPDGDPGSDRLFDQLHLRPAGRRLPHAAADHGQPQSALLRRAAGIVRPGKGQGPL